MHVTVAPSPHDGKRPALFSIAPSFLTAGNDFTPSGTLVYLGFCFSWMGTWSTAIVNDAHAADAVGFDWSVTGQANIGWASSMYRTMGDKKAIAPVELGQWYAGIDTTATVGEGAEAHSVSLHYAGASDLTLWAPDPTQRDVWSADIGYWSASPLAVANGQVFVSAEPTTDSYGKGQLLTFDAVTGAAGWTYRDAALNTTNVSPLPAGGRLYAGSPAHLRRRR